MTLNNTTLSASADQTTGTGKAGVINISNKGPITVANAIINAKGGATGGDGEEVTLTVDPTTNAIDLSTAQINANASSDANNAALGGQVTISKATGQVGQILNVNAIIKVDGGKKIATTDSDGKITLNTVPCQQWKTGFANAGSAYPVTYWNCIDGTRATGMPVATAANNLQQGLRALLGTTRSQLNPSVQIYVMPTITSFQAFFGLPTGFSAWSLWDKR